VEIVSVDETLAWTGETAAGRALPCLAIAYHIITDEAPDHTRTLLAPYTTEMFRADLEWLAGRYRFISYPQLHRFVADHGRLPRGACLLTFDDGYREVAEVAAPLLKSMGIPAVVFVCRDFVDNGRMFYRNKAALAWRRIEELGEEQRQALVAEMAGLGLEWPASREIGVERLRDAGYADEELLSALCRSLQIDTGKYLEETEPYLTRSQLAQLHVEGFTIGAHGCSHVPFSEIHDEAELRREYVESIRFVGELVGEEAVPFAFPFHGDPRARRIVASVREQGLLFDVGAPTRWVDGTITRFWAEEPPVDSSGGSSLASLVDRYTAAEAPCTEAPVGERRAIGRESAQVAIVVPVHDRRASVVETLESIEGQAFRDFHAFVVDDGSTDGSAQAVRAWMGSDASSRRYTVVSQDHRGVSAARNRGIELGQARPYVAFLDSDDLWPEDFLARAVECLAADDGIVAATADQHYVDHSLDIDVHRDHSGIAEDATSWIFTNDGGITSNSVLRTQAVLSCGGFDEELETGSDTALYLQLSRLGAWRHLPGAPVEIRVCLDRDEARNLSARLPDRHRRWAQVFESFITQHGGHRCIHYRVYRRVLAMRWMEAAEELSSVEDHAAAASCRERASFWHWRIAGDYPAFRDKGFRVDDESRWRRDRAGSDRLAKREG
jgi:glycosyltransferase involved in cell wall biosynthesis/peptidoglycan/xylan/chitin deacetylase (PgdA/CDA1 family)